MEAFNCCFRMKYLDIVRRVATFEMNILLNRTQQMNGSIYSGHRFKSNSLKRPVK